MQTMELVNAMNAAERMRIQGMMYGVIRTVSYELIIQCSFQKD